MKSQVTNRIEYYLMIVLCLLSVAGMIGTVYMTSLVKTQQKGAMALKKETLLLKDELERGYLLRSHFTSEMLSTILLQMKFPYWGVDNAILLLVPPSPCQACINEEFECLDKQEKGAFVVLVEKALARNISVYFHGKKHIEIRTYAKEEVADELFQTMDQLIYVTLKNGQIVSPFVTSKQLSGETRLYYPFID